jgi:hypothetical protein
MAKEQVRSIEEERKPKAKPPKTIKANPTRKLLGIRST